MLGLRWILIFATIWAATAGCSSDKPAPFVGDIVNPKPDASLPPDPDLDGGASETSTPIDGGTMPPTVCTDAGSCSIILTTASNMIPADGKAQTVITASIDARVGGIVEFSISGPGLWDNGKNSIPVLADISGLARANFVSDASGGIATITARWVTRDTIARVNVEMPALADITYSTQHNLMGVKSSGFNESNQITFKILAPNGVPYPDGLIVNFEHKPLAGSTIGTQPTCNMLDCVVKDTGVTEKGQVQLSLASGTLAAPAAVSITATAGGQTKRVEVTSPIVGAKVSGSGVSIECSPRNVPALLDTDCIRSRVDAPFKCTVTLADRFNNSVGLSTTVKYQSEAGIIGTTQISTPMYPAADLGKATGTIGTIGGVLPLDVFPMTGEYSASFSDACHPSGTPAVHNPRDGIVSIIAMMTGEEGFIDKNGDGIYNPGEPFIDLSEPFVDSNDNGTWDSGEFFQDVNNNSRWDRANAEWDDSTMLWTETRIVYTGQGNAVVDAGNQIQSRFFVPGPGFPPEPPLALFQPTPTVVAPISLLAGETRDIGLWFSDLNFNVLAPPVKYAADVGMGDPATVSIAANPQMTPVRQEGFFFTQQYCDGAATETCGMICPPSSATQQCLVRSSVGGFEYGVDGVIRVKASTIKGSFDIAATANVLTSLSTLSLSGVVR